ncbi:MAG: Crp/Fnr family transcriptional regulator [Bacteroidales bacterium]|nr:Crp/Fnr family transcriptional regulator [Bacteroidales bacterium]
MDDIYDKILELPLFQGISKQKLEGMIASAKFNFIKYTQYSSIARRGTNYTNIKFIISGRIKTEHSTPDEKIRITQEIAAPHVIAPHFLFGINTRYPYNIYALEETSVMEIDKPTLISLMHYDDIFLLNMLNITSAPSQKAYISAPFISLGSVVEKLAYWVQNSTNKKAENINIYCRLKDLYTFFGVQRSSYMYTMEKLKEAKIIDSDANKITILDRETLVSVLHQEDNDTNNISYSVY